MEAEAEAEAAEERGGKEREAVAGRAVVNEEMEMEEGEIEGEGAQAEEEEEEEEGNGDASKREEDGAVERKGAKMKMQNQQPPYPSTPDAGRSRASPRGRGGGWRRGGFHHRPWSLKHHKPNIFNIPGVYGGAIILCNRVTKRESFRQKIFCLPDYATSFIRKIRAGMLLFVFEREERKLCGVFEATSDGALNILPNAVRSSRKFLPAQVRFRRVWFCKPMAEAEFSDAIKGLQPQMSFFGISYQQVLNLVHLFASKRIMLQSYQKPKSRVVRDYKFSLARAGLGSSLNTHSCACPSHSSSMLCNSRIPLPHGPFMYAKENVKHAAYNCESPLQPQLKSVIIEALDIKEEPSADYIPLDLDDCNSDNDTVLSDKLGTVSFYSRLVNSISYEGQDRKPFNAKQNEDDGHHSPVLNQSFVSVSETCQNSAIAHFMKERQSSMLGKGCKRKAMLQFDDHSDLSSPRSCAVTKKVSFSFGGDEISVTSDKELHRPALAELKQNREAVIQEREQEFGCWVQDIQSKGGDDSAKRSKLMSLSFAERLANQHVTGGSFRYPADLQTSG